MITKKTQKDGAIWALERKEFEEKFNKANEKIINRNEKLKQHKSQYKTEIFSIKIQKYWKRKIN